jgi:hydroxymethylglutaryl-CoA lyase
MGIYELSLGDTIGVATPNQVKERLQKLLTLFPAESFAVHFHDTYGMGLVNTYVALELGITTVDSSFGGLGGCPYAPGAAGNIATEDLVYMLHGMGVDTGIDLNRLCQASRWMEQQLGRKLPSKVIHSFSN